MSDRGGTLGTGTVRGSPEEAPMDIGRPQRIIEVEPVSLPLPDELPDLEPAPAEPTRCEPDPAR
jgi:hypothetical protein